MAAINLNSIIGMSLARTGSLPRQNPVPQESTVAPSTGRHDAFTRGEWWKNQAKGELGAQQDLSLYSRGDGAGTALATAVNAESRTPVAHEGAEGETSESGRSAGAGEGDGAIGVKTPDGEPLPAADLELLNKLQQADRDVRAHEMAHIAAAGAYAKGAASFSYQRGPDGKSYAVAGEVAIDMGKESSPDATLAKMRVVRQAALAPKDPSPQDQKVASQATINIAEAVSELRVLAQAAQGENTPALQKDSIAGEQSEAALQSRDIFRQNSPLSGNSKHLALSPFKSLGPYGQPASSPTKSVDLDLMA